MNKIKGFTLIELLLVCQVIMIFGFIHLPYMNKKVVQKAVIIEEIITTIENMRLDAIINQKSIQFGFSNHAIYNNSDPLFYYQDIIFHNDQKLHFNKYGHISKASTIYFELKKKQYKLVFNLGQGAFYIEEL